MLTPLTSLEEEPPKKHRSTSWKWKNPKRAWATDSVKNAKLRAKNKGLPFDITVEYIENILPDNCPVFNTPFIYRGNGVAGEKSPSLDRIDPVKGYVEGNVVVISSKANNIKSAYKSTDIFMVAAWLQTIENKG
jgi:hypothetical protein